MITNIFWITLITILHVSKCNDLLKPAVEANKISSRDYPSASGSSYYATFSGYPSYPPTSASADPFKPSPDYGGGVNYGGTQDTRKKPAYPSYPSYPTTYYPTAASLPDCQDQMMNNVVGDILQTGGVARFGLLRSIVAAVTAGILAKIPIILAIKALMIKLILVPLGFLVLSLPIILPILLLFSPLWNKIKETFVGPTTTPQTMFVMVQPVNATNTTETKGKSLNSGRDIFMAIVESDKCFERLACQLGSRDANSVFIKPVSWLLKFLQTFKFVQNNIEIRSTLKRYRDAYLQGVTLSKRMDDKNNSTADLDDSDICTDDLYPCDIPALYSRPEFSRYSRYL